MSQQVISQTPNAQSTTQLNSPAVTTTHNTVVPTIDGWELYPEGIDNFNPFECDALEARNRLSDQANLIFSDNDVSIDVIDASGKSQFWL
jgi:hypothetical protein